MRRTLGVAPRPSSENPEEEGPFKSPPLFPTPKRCPPTSRPETSCWPAARWECAVCLALARHWTERASGLLVLQTKRFCLSLPPSLPRSLSLSLYTHMYNIYDIENMSGGVPLYTCIHCKYIYIYVCVWCVHVCMYVCMCIYIYLYVYRCLV